ncbi:MAG TPA: hypothetical protein VIV60_27255, partial [Polyangiaceae bacterium]
MLSLSGILSGCNDDGSEPSVRMSTGGSMDEGGGQSGASTGGVAGGSSSGSETTEVGATCRSSSGLTGTVVESQSRCALDDAFCEAIADGHYCTGGAPFVCPSGQVRTGWTTCGFPSGGSSSGGATGNNGGQSGASTGGVAGGSSSGSETTEVGATCRS